MNTETKGKKNAVWKASLVEQTVRDHYDSSLIGEIQQASLIREGFNHNYLIKSRDGSKYVFRVYLRGKYYVKDDENGDDLRFELDLLTFLRSKKDLSVAEPLPSKSGQTLGSLKTTVNGKNETRFFALFQFAKGAPLEGRIANLKRPQLFDLGVLVAQIHQAADEFETHYYRYHLNDETYLLDSSLAVIDQYSKQYDMEDTRFFRPHGEELRSKVVDSLPKTKPTYGIIHSDLHEGNIFFDEGSNQFTIIDFDHCAYGWRAYDISPCLELGQTACQHFLDGYNSIRQLSLAEQTSLKTFTELREIWDIGDMALFTPLWGKPVDKDFVKFAHRRLHCLNGESWFCLPPPEMIAWNLVAVTMNIALFALVVVSCRKLIKSNCAWVRYLPNALSGRFQRIRPKY